MNTRALYDHRSDLPSELARQLGFIENVCDLLIQSRFDNGHAEAWAFPDQPSTFDCGTPFIIRDPLSLDDNFEIVPRQPRFAAPIAERAGERESRIEREVRDISASGARADALLTREAAAFPAYYVQPRGSPAVKIIVTKIGDLKFEIRNWKLFFRSLDL